MKTLRSETGEEPAGEEPAGEEPGGEALAAGTESSPARRRGGRPRQWSSAAERNRAAGQRRTERLRLLTQLQLALLNAHWEDPDLQRLVNTGEELEVLRALIAHFRRRHWSRVSEIPAAAEHQDKSGG
jgi:hypothetical protein